MPINLNKAKQVETPHADLEDVLPRQLPNTHLLELLPLVPLSERLLMRPAVLGVSITPPLLPIRLTEETVVVLLALVIVTKNLISLLDLYEFGRISLACGGVRMIDLHQIVVAVLDFLLGSPMFDTKGVVVTRKIAGKLPYQMRM